MQGSNHLNGQGCPQCSYTFVDTKKFIENATKKNGDRYDYSCVKYVDYKTPVKLICKKHGSFNVRPTDHLHFGRGCLKCEPRSYSKVQIEWLNLLITNLAITINHAENVGEHVIKKSKYSYSVDGYCGEKNAIFEFHGCFFHGCTSCYKNRDDVNKLNGITFDVLYYKTTEKKDFCEKKGYKYIEMWGCEWEKIKKSDKLFNEHLDVVKLKLNSD